MNTHYLPDDQLARGQVEDAYENSDQFATDAIEHVADAADVPDWMLAGICQWYATTSKYATVVDDILAGERDLS